MRTKRVRRGHLMRVSSMIRGDQIADYIGARINPTEGYENDVCIYIKPNVPTGFDFKFEGHPYLDMIDGWALYPLMRNHPEVPVIMISERDLELMSKIIPNKLILIPQHHCNFDRKKRERSEIVNIGMIGTSKAFNHLPPNLEEELNKRGMNLIKYSNFFSRQDIIDFYMQLDLQLVWRPYRMRLSNPLKIVNSCSFGIPSVVFEETVFKEVEGSFLQTRTLEGLLENIDRLRGDPFLYDSMSKKCLEISERYHIENIAKLYQQLT